MIVGASTGSTIDLTLSALYTQVVLQLWGGVGGSFFNFALAIAALTTAVGLTASTAEYFEEVYEGRQSYRKIVLVTILISIVVGTTGLTNIVTVIGPLLDACYPACIVLVLYYVFMPSLIKKYQKTPTSAGGEMNDINICTRLLKLSECDTIRTNVRQEKGDNNVET